MKKLTKADLAIIGMYLAHAPLRFEPKNCKSILLCVSGKFLINDTLITGYNEDDGRTSSHRLLHPKNDLYPVLCHFKDLPAEKQDEITRINSKLSWGQITPQQKDAFNTKFIFENRVDLYDLIGQGKAIHYKDSKWWRAMEKGKEKEGTEKKKKSKKKGTIYLTNQRR